MSDGNKNEILEEQRKARQEFLELKKNAERRNESAPEAERNSHCAENSERKMEQLLVSVQMARYRDYGDYRRFSGTYNSVRHKNKI